MIMRTLKMCSLHKESFYGDIVAGCLYGKNILIGGLAQQYFCVYVKSVPSRQTRHMFTTT